MKQIATYLICIISMAMMSGCAKMYVNQGNRLYDQLNYNQATQYYEKALQRKNFSEATIRIADAYFQSSNIPKSEYWYSQVVNLPEAKPIHKFHYAEVLIMNGKCEEAKDYLREYLRDDPSNEKAKMMFQSCDNQSQFMMDSSLYTVEKVYLFGKGSDFSPAFYKDGIVFASERQSDKKVSTAGWTGRQYLDLFFTKQDDNNVWMAPELLKGELNSKVNEGPMAFAAGGNRMYFTRNNFLKNKTATDDLGVVNLKLYQADLVNGEWNNVKELPFNSDDYSTGHPTLSADGNTMYMISDRPGGEGLTDIYVSRYVNDNWTNPENLGKTINTSGKEMFPYLHNDSTLFFSSDTRLGLGGLDIYYSVLQKGSWSNPVNVGYPINSNRDDFGFIADSTGTMGYFSSNRLSEFGLDNIYRFYKSSASLTYLAEIVDEVTGEPVEGARVELLNNDTQQKETFITGPDGKVAAEIDPFSNYKLSVTKDAYFTFTKNIEAVGKTTEKLIHDRIELKRIVMDQAIALENIYYDFDKWNIRSDAAAELDKFTQFLKDNPSINIELGSHTDSRGTTSYNEKLSSRRAESAVKYLESKGIDAKRMTFAGYGESQLVNNCKDGVPCQSAEHQANRRTEFKVTGIMNNGQTINLESEARKFESKPNIKAGTDGATYKGEGKMPPHFYTIQIAASKVELPVDKGKYKAVPDLHFEIGEDRMYRYYAGSYNSFAEAEQRQDELQSLGFKDAFITAFSQGYRITILEAKKIIGK